MISWKSKDWEEFFNRICYQFLPFFDRKITKEKNCDETLKNHFCYFKFIYDHLNSLLIYNVNVITQMTDYPDRNGFRFGHFEVYCVNSIAFWNVFIDKLC